LSQFPLTTWIGWEPVAMVVAVWVVMVSVPGSTPSTTSWGPRAVAKRLLTVATISFCPLPSTSAAAISAKGGTGAKE
jgi:hypothetical protein